MRKISYIFLLLVGPAIFAQANYSAFKQGNEYYNNGQFQEAIYAYESILDKGEHSAELYFNLANAYYKTNQVAPSIFFYEKALQLDPNDKEIKNNLSFAQNMTIDAIETIPEAGVSKLVKNVVNLFNFDIWAVLSVAFCFMFVLLFLTYYFSHATTKKRLLFLSSFSFLFFGLLTLTFAFQKYNSVQKDRPAIVFAQETEIHVEPNLRSETAFNLHEGTKVQILENFNESWAKIKLSDGKTGWISTEDIRQLNNF
ncbi:MAG: tetratricopeptide repeat protein [Bacteroidia bacterium]|nr:tetratricopeptide repeat protein [Bacteroidia bacterium]NND52523.1 tetratricopeptide repeat protein [Flavobacteriaceae bacterium]